MTTEHDDDITANVPVSPSAEWHGVMHVAMPERKTIDEWAAIRGLDPGSWVMAGVRALFGGVQGRESTLAEFDAAENAARFTPHT